ncbi:MAG: aminoacyl-histidine dipeptidase [Lachnospiraceae bacterium]|nr:aminoacyl-histidine dipeptidase [Lachnospiraceae bacterium]
MAVLKDCKPQNVFKYFEEICNIPHGSYHIEKISDYLVNFAKEHSLKFIQDEDGNVIIFKDASAGYENSEPIILQGHMDMVCEKEADCDIDFEKDPLDIYIDGDLIKAKGTTLGGDDGIAVAYALAILSDDSLKHPALEVVITVNEEVGLLGANSIDLSELKGHTLINIDSEKEGSFLTSCAGGTGLNMELPVNRVSREGLMCSIKVDGLLGGHSGGEIHNDRANAIITIGRVLKAVASEAPIALVNLYGGLKDNAIPRVTNCDFLIAESDFDTVKETVKRVCEDLKGEYRVSDPDLNVTLKKGGIENKLAIDTSSLEKILFLLRNIPNGVMHMSMDIEGLVETSLNAGIMMLEEDAFKLVDSVRSSVTSRKYELCDRLIYLTEFLGGEAELEGDYPAWEYKEESPLRDKIAEVYEYMYGEKPVFEAIHAGLECGILSPKIKDMDAISMGPDMYDIHTPSERLSISSSERCYSFLIQLLASMK